MALALFPLAGCGGAGDEAGGDPDATPDPSGAAEEAEATVLGPVDGFDLAPTDLDRVAVGMMAPDFSLESLSGEVVTLSGFRGVKNVVLVFYRGHW
jgi:hypothetical protein